MIEEPSEQPANPASKFASALLTSNHFAAIGRVASDWALFETVVNFQSVELAQIQRSIGACFTAQISGIARKLDAYISLARQRGAKPGTISELCEFATDAGRVAEQRNRIVHDPWVLDDPLNPTRVEITARKKVRVEWIPVSTSEVGDVTKRILELMNRFTLLDEKVFKEAGLPT